MIYNDVNIGLTDDKGCVIDNHIITSFYKYRENDTQLTAYSYFKVRFKQLTHNIWPFKYGNKRGFQAREGFGGLTEKSMC